MNHSEIFFIFWSTNVDKVSTFMKIFEYIFMKPMKTIVNFVHNLEIEGIVKIHFVTFSTFNVDIRQETFELKSVH